MNKVRRFSRTPFYINSACRCEKHNTNVGGSKNSSHLVGFAFDIRVNSSVNRFKIVSNLIKYGFNRIGIYKDFIHVDGDDSKTQNVIWYA